VEASVDGAPFATTGIVCTGCGTASATWSYTPTAALTDGTRTLAWRAVDQAGNASPAAGRTVIIDTTAPVFVSVQATPNVAAVTAVFSEPLKCSTVAKGDFTASVNGASRTVNTAACAGTADDTIDLNISGTVLAGNALSVSLVSSVKDQANLTAAFRRPGRSRWPTPRRPWRSPQARPMGPSQGARCRPTAHRRRQ